MASTEHPQRLGKITAEDLLSQPPFSIIRYEATGRIHFEITVGQQQRDEYFLAGIRKGSVGTCETKPIWDVLSLSLGLPFAGGGNGPVDLLFPISPDLSCQQENKNVQREEYKYVQLDKKRV